MKPAISPASEMCFMMSMKSPLEPLRPLGIAEIERNCVKALEFLATLNPDSTITVPQDVAQQIAPQPQVRVLLLVPDDGDQWAQLTAEQFCQGYAESDE